MVMEQLKVLVVVISYILEFLFDPFFWAVVLLVAFQYYRLAGQKARNFDLPREPVLRPVLVATGYGIVGGLAGSLLMFATGINPVEAGIGTLWLVAVLLMLVKSRFLCFAYAGGIVSLIHLIFGVFQVDVAQVMGLVAVLHLVESLLILCSGHLGASPLYLKIPSGRLAGGFVLQKFWPIPLVVLTGGGPVAIIAALGYADLALARRPGEKSRLSAFYLSIYSITLLILAMLASKWTVFAYLAALFGPLGHELVIKLGRDLELTGKPYFVPPDRGIKILDVVTGTPAHQAGLASGDVILKVNGRQVNDRRDWEEGLLEGGALAELEYVEAGSSRLRHSVVRSEWGRPLGIIVVPGGQEGFYMELQQKGLLQRLWDWTKGGFK